MTNRSAVSVVVFAVPARLALWVSWAVLTGLVVAACSSPIGSGPLDVAVNPHGSGATFPVGSDFTYGLETLHVSGDTPVTLDEVSLLGPAEQLAGVELIGAMAARHHGIEIPGALTVCTAR